jgi:glycine C-acetyltransferase
MLFQRSRPHLFSNALPPTVACSALEAVRVLRREPALVERLHAITASFRTRLREIGYSPLDGEAAIIPIIVGETSFAIKMSQRLLDEGVFVTGFGFPVVPEGTARIRVQMSAALEDAHLDRALEAFERVGNELGLI